jgi:23S rRNA (pseudouridine1915-N3)-methyltransferase
LKITILAIGKTGSAYLREGTGIYLDRLKHYARVDYKEIPDIPHKGLSAEQLSLREGEQILRLVKGDDVLVLLDENGQQYSSRQFADFLQKKMNSGTKHLVLVIGGAFGFSQEVYRRASHQISLSKMTFSHEMVRLFLCEQLYRGFTILKGESYHHD